MMTHDSYRNVLDALAAHGSKIQEKGDAAEAQCPAHEDRDPSLSISQGTKGVLVHCHTGCETDSVLEALGMSYADLMYEPPSPNGATPSHKPRIVATYDYIDETGALLFQVVRYLPKTFRQRRPTRDGGWTWKLDDTRRVLYRLPAVLDAVQAGRDVYIAEGEKDVHALENAAVVATCNPGGAGKWRPDYTKTLIGAHVVIVADADKPGREHAQQIADALEGHAATIQIVQPATGCKDAADHLKAGHGLDELQTIDVDDQEEAERLEAAAEFAREVERETHRLRVREAAARKLVQERVGEFGSLDPIRLTDFLAIDDPDVTYRIDQLWPIGGRVVLAAQFKAGKTTLIANILRSLADGVRFLGHFDTDRPNRIILLDDELDPRTLRIWLREQRILNTDIIELVPLRGRLSTFDILDPATCTEWAKRIAGADIVILDCLRPVLDGLGLSEDKDAGRFLVAFDQMLGRAGASEGMVVHHMGHTGERSRGDSRILDWPDATWKLVREDPEDPSSSRYLSAYGRDVDVREGLLQFDPAARRLTYTGGSRKDTAAEELIPEILDLLTGAPEPMTGRQIERVMVDAGHGRNKARVALKRAIKTKAVLTERGSGNAILHRVNPLDAPVRHSAPPDDRRTESECAGAPIGAHGAHTPQPEHPDALASEPGGAPDEADA